MKKVLLAFTVFLCTCAFSHAADSRGLAGIFELSVTGPELSPTKLQRIMERVADNPSGKNWFRFQTKQLAYPPQYDGKANTSVTHVQLTASKSSVPSRFSGLFFITTGKVSMTGKVVPEYSQNKVTPYRAKLDAFISIDGIPAINTKADVKRVYIPLIQKMCRIAAQRLKIH